VVAAILAGSITFIFYRRVGHTQAAPRATTQILVAKDDLPVGATLAAKDLTLMDWYSDTLPEGAFTKTDAVIGRPLLFPVVANQPVLERDLGVEGAGIGLAGKIPEGMRAIAVRSNEISGVAGFLYPGSHVDCMLTFTPPGGKMPITRTVLQNVEVLTAGQTIEPDPKGRPQKVNVVTVLLNPEDAQRLQLASGQGNIQFVLRSGADQKQADVQPTSLDQLFPSERPKAVSHVKRPAPQAAPVYMLEVIQGTHKSVEKFDEDSSTPGTR
jgi:pilus assembly protein CpaB